MESITLKAPAKVNLLLEVLSRRHDGYHELRMIMQQLDLCDDIVISRSPEPGITVICGRAGVPDGPGNIAWRAARALLDYSCRDDGLAIQITKNIPVAAGLGGGSSDGASVLMGVNELLGLGLSRDDLMKIGIKLGADVPFFIYAPVAVAEGIGEILSPIERIPELSMILVNPNVHVSTAWVYKNLQLTSQKKRDKLPRSFTDVEAVCSIMANDLESVTIKAFPVINEIKECLLGAGASNALMSGSGPTVFGIFRDDESAARAAAELQATTSWFVKAVKGINSFT